MRGCLCIERVAHRPRQKCVRQQLMLTASCHTTVSGANHDKERRLAIARGDAPKRSHEMLPREDLLVLRACNQKKTIWSTLLVTKNPRETAQPIRPISYEAAFFERFTKAESTANIYNIRVFYRDFWLTGIITNSSSFTEKWSDLRVSQYGNSSTIDYRESESTEMRLIMASGSPSLTGGVAMT